MRIDYKIGESVLVRPPYKWPVDSWTGKVMYVVGVLRGGADFKLSSVPDGDWEVIMHASRLVEE